MTKKTHKLLQKQIKKHFPHEKTNIKGIGEFLNAVSDVYKSSDEDKALLKKSLKQTSDKLIQKNNELQDQITKLSEIKTALENTVSLLNSTIDATWDGILVSDINGNIKLFNKIILTIFNESEEEFSKNSLSSLKKKFSTLLTNYTEFLKEYKYIISHPDSKSCFTMEFKDGRTVDGYSQPCYNSGEINGRVWRLRDITELTRSEQEAIFNSYHDPLTSLPNRNLFKDRLQHAIQHTKRQEKQLAILFLDLDGFKYVNDTLGHEAGDQLLVMSSKRLKSAIRYADSLSRHGGDEFIILLEDIDSVDNIIQISERIFQEFQQPFPVSGRDVYISTSIGISLFPNDGDNAEKLIRNADMAMYLAKRKGGNNYQFFAKKLEKLSSRKLNLRNNLRRAIEKDEFVLFYQPRVDILTGRILGAEALIRWYDDKHKIITPDNFIPDAEENGLILPITEWVIKKSCAQIRKWHDLGYKDLSIAINLSGRHFQYNNLIQTIKEALQCYNLNPESIELEITESAIMENINLAITILSELRSHGMKIAIDDFGTGYSSLNYLKRLPITTVKIDKTFIDELTRSREDTAMISSIISLAHVFGLEVIAEGVETEDTLQILKELNCNSYQGYYFSKPVPSDEFLTLLKSQKK